MFNGRTLFAFAMTAALANPVLAAEDSCDKVFEQNVRDVVVLDTSFQTLNTIYDNYCQASGETKNSHSAVDFEAVIKKIPTKFAGSTGSSTERVNKFCREYNEVRYQEQNLNLGVDTVSVAALEQYNICRSIERENGVRITHSTAVPGAITVQFTFLEQNRYLRLEHVASGPNLTCGTTAIDGNWTQLEKKAYEFRQTFSILCERSGEAKKDGSTNYRATWLEIGTNFGPYSIPMPMDNVYNNELASASTEKIEGLNKQLSENVAKLSAAETKISTLEGQVRKLTHSNSAWSYKVISSSDPQYRNEIEKFINSGRPRLDGIAGALSTNGNKVNFHIWVRPDGDGSEYEVKDRGDWANGIGRDLTKEDVVILGFNNGQNNRLFVVEKKD